MNHVFNCIMLIDDDEPTNYFNEVIIEKSGKFAQIITFQTVEEAFVHLQNADKDRHVLPCIILLDLNMPVLSGWDFLHQYSLLPEDSKAECGVIILTASVNPEDKKRAASYSDVVAFWSKPLDVETVKNLSPTEVFCTSRV